MAKLVWDEVGKKLYKTGVQNGVIYPVTSDGAYTNGEAWNGLVQVDEKPTGGEVTYLYANNYEYGTVMSAEKFEGSIQAYIYPDCFAECCGEAQLAKGVRVAQQTRKPFGFTYRNEVGSDTEGEDYGYTIHLLYGCRVKPSQMTHKTINENIEAETMSWDFTASKVPVPEMKPTAHLMINSWEVDTDKLKELEKLLYGDTDTEPKLPLPSEISALLAAA